MRRGITPSPGWMSEAAGCLCGVSDCVTCHLHYNAVVSVELKPSQDDSMEAAFIKLMLESAQKGRTVTLEPTPDGGMTVSVPK